MNLHGFIANIESSRIQNVSGNFFYVHPLDRSGNLPAESNV